MTNFKAKKRKYEQVFQEFSKTLETQEPYLTLKGGK